MNLTILCPNARRCCVKVTPGKFLRQVLEEACLRNGFDVDRYRLENQGRCIDLALPFRLSGLPNNATLEMVPTADTGSSGIATIALQVPNGSRIEREFPVTMTLFSILECFSHVLDEDLLISSGDSVPCCSYMNRQYVGHIELKSNTLLSIGISSGKKCLIRYQRAIFTKQQMDEITVRIARENAEKQALLREFAQKKAENEDRKEAEKNFEEELRLAEKTKESFDVCSKDDAMDAVVQDNQLSGVPSSSASTFLLPDRRTSVNSFHFEMQNSMVDTRASTQHECQDQNTSMSATVTDCGKSLLRMSDIAKPIVEEKIMGIADPLPLASPCDRRTVIFLRQTFEDSNLNKEEISDEFFEVDVDDVKAQLKQLRAEINMNANRALVSKDYVKQKNREQKLLAYRHTVIRIPIGTRKIVQGQFRSAEPISHLFGWIRGILSCSAAFSLKLPLNHKLEDSDTLNFVDADVAPKSTVFIRFNDPSFDFESLCSGSLQECTQKEADNFCFEWLSQNTIFKPFTAVMPDAEHGITVSTSTFPTTLPHQSSRPSFTASTTPKWFKKK